MTSIPWILLLKAVRQEWGIKHFTVMLCPYVRMSESFTDELFLWLKEIRSNVSQATNVLKEMLNLIKVN